MFLENEKNTMVEKNDILYLFDRPSEPIFTGKGDDNVSLEVPTEYLVSLICVCIYEYVYAYWNQ